MGSVSKTTLSVNQHLTSSSARATSAAPTIFKPLCHHASKQTYADGAIYHNNPIQIADKERKLIWPNLEDEYPDIVVSIGTAFSPKSSPAFERTTPLRRGVFSYGKSLYKIAKNHIASSLNSEMAWENYMNVLQPLPTDRSRYVRLNPRLIEDPPGLDEVHRMKYMQDLTRDKFSNDDRIRKVALQLIASSFYFEKSAPAGSKENDAFQCKGLSHLLYITIACADYHSQATSIAACYQGTVRSLS